MNSPLYELNREIIKRRSKGKVLWQPRIDAWLSDRRFLGTPLPGKYEGCNARELYEKLGCSDRLYQYFNICLESRYDGSVQVEHIPLQNGRTDRDYKTVIHTPVGDLTEIKRGNNSNFGMMPEKWLVNTVEDLRVLCYVEEATSFSFNLDTYQKSLQQVGHLGLPVMFLPRTNIQKMLIELCGVENTYYLLADHPEEVEHYFKVLSKSQEGFLKAVAESPIEWINYGDNLHCKILPDYLFEKYILPEYEKRGDILHKAGKFLFSHWDGDVKDYLKYAKTCFLDGIEAVTPAPQGDVTLEEVKAAFGDEIYLIDGLPAVLFDDAYPKEMLEEETKRTLELFAGRLILGISDELSSTGDLARVELVNEIVCEHNAKIAN